MLHSLRVRLLLTLILVVMVAVGTLALFTNWSTTTEFQDYVAQDAQRNQRFMETLLQANQIGQDGPALQRLAQQLAAAAGDRVLLVNGQGRVLADSAGQLVGQLLPSSIPFPADQIMFTGEAVAGPGVAIPLAGSRASAPTFIRMAPAAGTTVGGASDLIVVRVPNPAAGAEAFLDSVRRSLALAIAAAGGAALLLTLLLSRRILGPVEALTAAARRMEKGDLTRRVQVRSRDEIGELAHAFNAMADGLTRLEQGRRRMVTDIAHELRTPLANLRGYLEALQDGLVQPTPALLASLHEEALLLSRLVDDLQELALAESRQLRLVRRPVALQAISDQAVYAVQPAAAAKGLTVTSTIAPDLPPVSGDPKRLSQVLRNLLQNAMTHTPPGGAITVSARPVGREIELRVRDTGTGIAPEQFPHIFERFFRADQSRARATGGAGLGLAIVKELIALHGGRIGVESAPGQGATFVIVLPAVKRGPRPAPAGGPPPARAQGE